MSKAGQAVSVRHPVAVLTGKGNRLPDGRSAQAEKMRGRCAFEAG